MHALGIARDFLADYAGRVRVGACATNAADVMAVEFLDFERARARAVVRARTMDDGA